MCSFLSEFGCEEDPDLLRTQSPCRTDQTSSTGQQLPETAADWTRRLLTELSHVLCRDAEAAEPGERHALPQHQDHELALSGAPGPAGSKDTEAKVQGPGLDARY